jgi:hypothetical protein
LKLQQLLARKAKTRNYIIKNYKICYPNPVQATDMAPDLFKKIVVFYKINKSDMAPEFGKINVGTYIIEY